MVSSVAMFFCSRCGRRRSGDGKAPCGHCGGQMAELMVPPGTGAADQVSVSEGSGSRSGPGHGPGADGGGQQGGEDEDAPLRARDLGAAIGAALGQGNPATTLIGYAIGRAVEGHQLLTVTPPEPAPGPPRDIGKEAVRAVKKTGRRMVKKVKGLVRSVKRLKSGKRKGR